MPLVSVVIPTWDRAQSFRKALDSALAQTETDLEVIVVDDGSPTDVAERAVRARADGRVRYIRLPEHRGVSAARNAGVQAATGKYVAFLDDDDEWLPDKLQHQVSVLEASGRSVCAVHTARFTVDEVRGRITTTHSPGGVRLGGENPVTTSSIMLKREHLLSMGPFDEELQAGEDYDMWMRLAQEFEFLYIDVPLVRYHIHNGSVTTDYAKKRRASERLLEKHWKLFAVNPHDLAREYAFLGVMWYREGSLSRASRAFWRAIRSCPSEIHTYSAAARLFVSFRTLTMLLQHGAHKLSCGRLVASWPLARRRARVPRASAER